MNCPHCGADAPVVKARCTGCGRLVSARPDVATAVLTPLPTPAPGIPAADDVTRFAADPDRTRILPEDGGFGVAGPAAPPPSTPSDLTRLPDASHPSASAGPLAIGQRFGPRYHIVKLLGIGGMGAVYQAWDSALDVVVALKVIRPEATGDPLAASAIERRFKQELLLARQVTHKNVVRIHDLGEIDGVKYITMSFIQGADLSTVLQREGQLPVPAALKLTRQIASGLLAAHEAGVVHRDLKPANIMIEGDHAIIMDFGIARSSGGAPPMPAGEPLAPAAWPDARNAPQTMAGSIVGTIAYMAPEQARGEPVDQRADLYALGLIISDMVLGLRRRNSDLSALEELQRRIAQRPAALRTVDPRVPEALDRIVSRLVEPDPAARFQTTAELVAALDRLDDHGVPLPLIRRLTPRLVAATAVIVTLLLAGTYYVTRQALAPPTQHDPVSVIIADFQNTTNDAAFDRTLEPTLRRALEGAGFISAYDRTRISGALGVRPPEILDEVAAREIAVKQGLGVVLAASIGPQGSGYALSMKLLNTVTGTVITTVQGRAANKDGVLPAATRLVASVRTALGDETSESDQIFAMTSLSVQSLDVVRHYAAGMEASSYNRFEEARQHFARAVELDPKFGLGYSSLAAASRNLGRVQDAEKYINEALRYLDGMTERERFSTRGFYYRMTSDFQQCVKEYGELVARYAADIVGRNQRALCMSKLRDMRGAVAEMRHVVNMLPNRAVFRDNLALYSNYAGDFETAEKEARTVGPGDAYAALALAFAQLGRGQTALAIDTYEALRTLNPTGASMAAAGLADIATLEGRYADAIGILQQAVAVDLAAKNLDRAATKLSAVAHAELLRGRPRAAVEAADRALASSQAVKIRFMAARTFVAAGELDRARPLVDRLVSELQAEPQAYGRIVQGEIALAKGDARQAIAALTEANALLDTWIGHFVLGRAYLEAGALIQADSEFDRCIKRRGEALSLFVDEDPTFGYFPPVYYYQGRVREGLKNAGFTESFKAYLEFRGRSNEDPLLADVRRRVGS
jgi:eukaryotic-like serine/threonine-protein kinase